MFNLNMLTKQQISDRSLYNGAIKLYNQILLILEAIKIIY